MRAPYIPRMYPRRPPVLSGRGGGGGGGSTGNIGGDIVKAINAIRQQGQQNALAARQDEVANQLMNLQHPPRAGAVGPVVNPATGQVTGNIAPTAGTAPFTGGMEDLQSRVEAQRLINQLYPPSDPLKEARIASQLALAQQRTGRAGAGVQAGNASRWRQQLAGGQPGQAGQPAGKGGKPAPYVAGSSDPQDPASDDFGKIRADFDQQYGKGAYDKFIANYPNLKPDAQGNYSILDKDGNPTMTVPGKDAPFWMNRNNAARIAHGQDAIGSLPSGVNPNSGQASGSQVNPVPVQSDLELRALPMGTYFQKREPDGSVSVHQKAPLQPATTAQPQATTSSADQVGQDQSALAAQQDQQDQGATGSSGSDLSAAIAAQRLQPDQGLAQADQGVLAPPNPALVQAMAASQGQGEPVQPPDVTGLSYLGNNAALGPALAASQPRDLVS